VPTDRAFLAALLAASIAAPDHELGWTFTRIEKR
jgi:hypothetical protein